MFKTKAVGESSEGAADLDQVRCALALLADHENGIELRALPFGKGITGKWDDAKLLQFVTDHNDAKGIYYTLNPVAPDLIPAVASTGSKVGDILRRRWLLVDVDPKRPPDTNASEVEHQAAATTANRVLSNLVGFGWPVPVLIDSGNGYHLLWRIDLPADEESRLLVKAALYEFAVGYGDAATEIDTKVFNANRISKLPGTWARKGPHSPERPHRICRLVSASDAPTVVTVEQLRAVLPKEPVRAKKAIHAARAAFVGQAENDGASVPFGSFRAVAVGDEAWANKALDLEAAKVAATSPGGRNDQLFRSSAALAEIIAGGGLDRATVEQRLFDAAGQCGLGEHEIWRTIRSGFDRGSQNPRMAPERNGKPEKPRDQTEHERCRPKTVRLTDLMEMDLPAPRWAVPSLLPEGLTILAGKPKLGKSWLALNLALTIAAGGTALGTIRVVPGDVLYLALEDRLRRIQDRSRKLLPAIGCEASSRLQFATEWPRTDDYGLDYIEEWAAGVERPTLIVIDVWAKFRPIYKTQGSQYDQDYQHGAACKSIADKYGASALALHHTKKAAAEDVIEEISGTLGIAGSADGAIVLKRSRNENSGTISVTGRDLDERDMAVEFDPTTCAWKCLGNAIQVGHSKVRAAISAAFKSKPDALWTPSELAAVINMDRETVKKEIYRLVAEDALRKVGPRYGVPLAAGDVLF